MYEAPVIVDLKEIIGLADNLASKKCPGIGRPGCLTGGAAVT